MGREGAARRSIEVSDNLRRMTRFLSFNRDRLKAQPHLLSVKNKSPLNRQAGPVRYTI